MTMHTLSWALARRYGDPLVRALMVELAMESGHQARMGISLADLADVTEIRADLLPALLDDLVDGAHLVAWSIGPDGDGWVLFTEEACPVERPDPTPKGPTCPAGIRRRTIIAFRHTCVYCGRDGDATRGPDGTAWSIDRIVAGGPYQPQNVTLACRPCNSGKRDRPAPPGTRSLADIENGGFVRDWLLVGSRFGTARVGAA